MNVVIMQPFYLYLRKHFHLVQRADLYIHMDTVQFIKQGHHNRNRIKTAGGHLMLTVPVLNKGRRLQSIAEVEIDNTQNWRHKHWSSIRAAYAKAPHFERYTGEFEAVYSREWEKLADLNISLIEKISALLGITRTRFLRLSDIGVDNDNPTQRLIDICEAVGAARYIIGTRARDYMEEQRWKNSRVELEYFEPEYPPYPQLHGDFLENCAIIDLLFNCGPESGRYIWGEMPE